MTNINFDTVKNSLGHSNNFGVSYDKGIKGRVRFFCCKSDETQTIHGIRWTEGRSCLTAIEKFTNQYVKFDNEGRPCFNLSNGSRPVKKGWWIMKKSNNDLTLLNNDDLCSFYKEI